VQQYFRVFVQSLTLAVFLRWLSGGMAFVTGDVNTLENAMMWLVVVVLMSIIAQIFFNGAWRILLSTGNTFSVVNSSFGGPTILQTAQAAVGRRVADAAGSVATIATMAGRPEVALAAGAVAGVARSYANNPRAALENYGREEGEGAPPSPGNVFVGNGSQPMYAPAASRREAAPQTTVSAGEGATTARTEVAPGPGTGGAATGTSAPPPSSTGQRMAAPSAGQGAASTPSAQGVAAPSAGQGAASTPSAQGVAAPSTGQGMAAPPPAGRQQPAWGTTPQPGFSPSASPQEQQTWVDMPNLSVTEANVVFKTIASQNAWGEEQQKQVNTAVQAAATPQDAVNRLVLAPGFERTSTEDLRKAVNAARMLYDNQRRV
jgi:hypothetical protein